jgi:hypothetical protein
LLPLVIVDLITYDTPQYTLIITSRLEKEFVRVIFYNGNHSY